MSLLLLLCLTLACLPITWPEPVFGPEPTASAAITGGIVAVQLLIARLFTARTIGQLARYPDSREAISRAHGLRRFLFFFLNLGGYAVALLVGGWGWTARHILTTEGVFLPGGELLVLAPYLLALIGSWFIYYDAEHTLFLTSPSHMRRGEFWSRRGYVMFLLRHHLLMVFTPILLMVFQLGVLRAKPDLLDSPWAKLAAFVGLFLFVLLLPSLVPLILGLRQMPPGPIRERLEASARRLRVKYRNLYVWDTRNNLATAMVTGIVPWLRQIVFTDLLLSTLTDDEIEAVFGHEVGHVRHGHLLYYAVFLVLSFLTLGAVYRVAEPELPTGHEPLVLTVIATGCYLFVVFGFISRRCERQADVFGCKAVSCPQVTCEGHDHDTQLVPAGASLCRTGVRTFVRALERVEEVNGMARQSMQSSRGLFGRMAGVLRLMGVWLATWQHSTIEKRMAFLRTLADEPERERSFQRKVTALRWGLMLLLVAGVAGVIAFGGGWKGLLEGL
jgi:Zn-dependent protease with chaperone function